MPSCDSLALKYRCAHKKARRRVKLIGNTTLVETLKLHYTAKFSDPVPVRGTFDASERTKWMYLNNEAEIVP